jgi:hypothetical protein
MVAGNRQLAGSLNLDDWFRAARLVDRLSSVDPELSAILSNSTRESGQLLVLIARNCVARVTPRPVLR